MLLVTGGFAGSFFLDSTEVFDPSLGSWVITAKLPQPLEGLRATSINNRVLIFGTEDLTGAQDVAMSVCPTIWHKFVFLISDLQAALSALSISES